MTGGLGGYSVRVRLIIACSVQRALTLRRG